MFVILRVLSLILIVAALMLLGADAVSSLENGGKIIVRSLDQVWALFDKTGMDAFHAWAGRHLPAHYPPQSARSSRFRAGRRPVFRARCWRSFSDGGCPSRNSRSICSRREPRAHLRTAIVGETAGDEEVVRQTIDVADRDRADLLDLRQFDDQPLRPARDRAGQMQMGRGGRSARQDEGLERLQCLRSSSRFRAPAARPANRRCASASRNVCRLRA